VTPGRAPFFEPRSIAVIGASRDAPRVGGSVFAVDARATLTTARFLNHCQPAGGSLPPRAEASV